MLNGHVVACDDDALDEQPYQALPAGEVELIEPFAQRCSEGCEILAQAVETRAVEALRVKLLSAEPVRLARGVEALPTRLELFDVDGAVLIGIDEPLDLEIEPSLRAVEARALPRHLRGALSACPPRRDLLPKHARALDP